MQTKIKQPHNHPVHPKSVTIARNRDNAITKIGLDLHPQEFIKTKGTICLGFPFVPSLILGNTFNQKFQLINTDDVNLEYQ